MGSRRKTRVVTVTSVFPAPKDTVFRLLQSFDTLSKIAFPYITFTPVDGRKGFLWKEGETFVFRTRLFGLVPCGTHTIRVVEFGKDTRIYTSESNTYVPTWNHEIVLRELGREKIEYTDSVEIYAGRKTFVVYVWAQLFYRHRQKKWRKMLAALPKSS